MSILLGIDQSLDDRLARGRRSPPRGRRKTARPETGLMVVERMDRARGRDRRPISSRARTRRRKSNGVAQGRRDDAPAAIGRVLGARSWHDLLARDGRQRSARPRVLLADELRLGSSIESISRRYVAGGTAARNTGRRPQGHRLDGPRAPRHAGRREPIIYPRSPRPIFREAILRRTCRVSERGTTGTVKSSAPSY